MYKPNKEKKPLVLILNSQLDEESAELLEKIQEKTGASKAEIVRRAIKEYANTNSRVDPRN